MRYDIDVNSFGYTYSFERADSSSSTSSSTDVEVKRLVRSDVVKTQKVADFWRPPTAYQVTDRRISPVSGSLITVCKYLDPNLSQYDYRRSESGLISAWACPSLNLNQNWISENGQNRAETQALLKARDSKVNVALSVAEMDKTFSMIAARATSIAKSYRALRRGDVSGAAKALGLRRDRGKSLAKQALEVQYGWTPLLSDVYGAYEELTRQFRSHGIMIKAVSRTKESSSDRVNYLLAADGSVRGTYVDTSVKECQVILWFEVKDPYTLLASATGLTNPFEIAWELVPFSFVVDWFIPVGNLLGSLTATEGLTYWGGTKTLRSTTTRKATVVVNPETELGGAVYLRQGAGYGVETLFEMSRYTLLVPPPGRLYFKSPLSASHAFNAVALLRAIL